MYIRGDKFFTTNPPLLLARENVVRNAMKHLTLLFFILTFQLLFAQKEELLFYKEYVIFRQDTFNRLDENAQINGKGLAIQMDTAITMSRQISYDCFVTNKYSYKCERIISKLDTAFKIEVFVVGIGEYANGKKQGIWWFSSNKNLDNLDAEVFYENGNIIGPIQIYNRDSTLGLRIEKDPNSNKWITFKWNDFENSFYQPKEMNSIDIFLETFNIE